MAAFGAMPPSYSRSFPPNSRRASRSRARSAVSFPSTRQRYFEFPLERPAEGFLRPVADRVGALADGLRRSAQMQLGRLQAPDSEVADRRHADGAREAVHEGTTRQRCLL